MISCQPEQKASASDTMTIEGELSFKLIEFGSYYALADGLGDQVFDLVDSLETLPASTLSEHEQDFLSIVNLLKDNGLLFLPSFNLATNQGNYRVYLDTSEYNKVSPFKREDLVKENQKVKIRLKGQLIPTSLEEAPPLFRCSEILSIEKVPGKTHWRK